MKPSVCNKYTSYITNAGSIALLFMLLLCNNSMAQMQKNMLYGAPVMSAEKATSSYENWLFYESHYLNLSPNFLPLDVDYQIISKTKFLKQLMTRQYLPLKLNPANGRVTYQLVQLKPKVGNGYRAVIKQLAEQEYHDHVQAFRKMPAFNFVDVNGKVYNSETTKGKILVLKTWFIKCEACVDEMPNLNELVNRYHNRKDILFLSLALDSKKDLQAFLKNTQFNYAVVPNQENYIQKQLSVNEYPTHLLVNKQGVITKVTNYIGPLEAALKGELSR
ncbi:TlpA family protein disulfide reductase [Mucilaginibacter lacusdianchii]|uniref:TlpA family protein disulfide reductase n=1 Tax=Mucilaginibacter lacusdianchii TaxID=2684211 RepID=UPI00131DD23F|nr:TlpA disulfide reductase family protein [Mucilaginibacter sp. JXJ CY 39]